MYHSDLEHQFPSFRGRIGIAESDITPPVGIYMGNWGASTSLVSTGNHLSLSMTCMTFQTEDQDEPLIMIGLDLGWWKDSSDEAIFRNSILHYFKLPPSQLLIFLSHTHSGPSLCRMDASKPGGDLVIRYLERLEDKAISLIDAALQSAEDSFLTWQYGRCDLARNRDLRDPDADRYLVGYNPDGKVDNTLLCGLISGNSGNRRGVIVNYACHPTTLGWTNTLVSPDYPGAMRYTIAEHTGMPVLFMQGASGDLAPIVNYTDDLEIPNRYGRQLGYAVLSTVESMAIPGRKYVFSGAVESGAPLALWGDTESENSKDLRAIHHTITYDIKDFPKYDELEETWKNTPDGPTKERLWRKMGIRKAIGDQDKAEISLWAWKMGDAWVIAQPNEPYSTFQIQIRALFPELPIAVSNLVNGSYGYLPPRELYKENIYAVWQTPFAEGSLERLIGQVHLIISNLEK